MTASPFSSPQILPRVLIVDGDADNRELYCDSFTLAGWIVTGAADGREALVDVLKVRPSILVTELRLPLIDGVALCQLLRRDRTTATVPILVVTGETRATELARAERAGANAVLIKPSPPEVILAEMWRLIRTPVAAPAEPLPAPTGRRTALVKAHHRLATTSPEEPPAGLSCPICARPLKYRETFIGGVSSRHSERWDYYECDPCGRFQYRYRTRKLRQID